MTDRNYVVTQLRLYGLVVGVVGLYAVVLPKLMLFLNFARRFPWLVVWDPWSLYVLVGLVPLLVLGIYRTVASVHVRAAKEVSQRLQDGCTYLIMPPMHARSALAARFREKGDIWAQIARLLPEKESLIVDLVRTPHQLCYLLTGRRTTLEIGVIPQLMATLPDTQVRLLSVTEDPCVATLLGAQTVVCRTLRPQKGKVQIRPATSEPFLAMVGALAQLPNEVSAGLRLYLRSDADSSQAFQRQADVQSIPLLNQRNPDYTRSETKLPWERRLVTQQEQELQRDLHTRAGRHLLDVCVLVWTQAPDPAQATVYADMLSYTLQSQYTPTNPLSSQPYTGDLLDRTYPPFRGRHWTDQELGTLWQFVGKAGYEIAPMLELSRTRPLTPDPGHFYHHGMQTLPVRMEG